MALRGAACAIDEPLGSADAVVARGRQLEGEWRASSAPLLN
jgi:hypothetical protein